MRKIETETSLITIGTVAASSHEAPFFNLISPSTIRRLAIRKQVGAKKYGTVQWRQGINDAEFVADRWNHFMEHVLAFMEHGNETDDNIAGMLWALDCISEVERLSPESLKLVVGISNLFGKSATEFHQQETVEKSPVVIEPKLTRKHKRRKKK